VFFNQTNSTTEVREDGNCIVINFVSTNSLRRVADSAVYRILGVIPNE
jgi:DNA-dependent RNA polymerase auxiliary subunit epsilon